MVDEGERAKKKPWCCKLRDAIGHKVFLSRLHLIPEQRP